MRRSEGKRETVLFDDQSRTLDRFGLVLLMTTVAVITLSLVDLQRGAETLKAAIGQILVSVFVGGTLVLSARASGVSRRYRMIVDIVVTVGVILTIAGVLLAQLASDGLDQSFQTASPFLLWVILSVLAPLLVLRRLVKHERATGQTLLGAVSAYLLIALAFTLIFLALDDLGSGLFESQQPTTSFMYYSLVTITTLGYGDLAAATPFGRLLSVIEAVVGQVYLVTFVAMIVGLIVSQRQAER
jgi:hypothetical protein